MHLVLGVIVVAIFAYICAFHYKYMRAFYLSLKICGPPALPLLGNGLLFMNKTSAGDFTDEKFEISTKTDSDSNFSILVQFCPNRKF